MTTALVSSTAPDRPLGTVGEGRYLLDPDDAPGAPRTALDIRLGRRVRVQSGPRATSSARAAARLVRVSHPGLARLLDAGEDVADGTRVVWTVFPVGDGVSLRDVAARTLPLEAVAALAAWVTATVGVVRSGGGGWIPVGLDDVLVDPTWLSDATVAPVEGDCPIRWMPSLADGVDVLPALLAGLSDGRTGRDRRRLTGLVARSLTPAGRPRAVRDLAAVAGLDPRVLGLPTPVPHHAERGRGPSGPRPSVGILPTPPRRDVTCASAEVFS